MLIANITIHQSFLANENTLPASMNAMEYIEQEIKPFRFEWTANVFDVL